MRHPRHSTTESIFTSWANLTTLIFTVRCTLVQSAVLLSYVVCPSVRPSVRPVPWSHRSEFFENNFTAEQLRACHLCEGWPQHGRSGATGTPPKLGRNRGGKFNCGRIGVAIFSAWSREIPASHGMRHKLCADCGRDYPWTQIRSFSCGSIRTSPLKCRGN